MTDDPDDLDDLDVPDEPESEVPDGAAVFPLIPAELAVNPLLLAVLHSYVFLHGSDDEVVHPAAATEALEYMTSYLLRLDGPALVRLREDFACLVGFARQEKWPKQLITFLKTFLAEHGIGGGEE